MEWEQREGRFRSDCGRKRCYMYARGRAQTFNGTRMKKNESFILQVEEPIGIKREREVGEERFWSMNCKKDRW